jgi:hypothetical protein
MIKKNLSPCVIIAACIAMTSCSVFQTQEGGNTSKPRPRPKPAPVETQKLMRGSWQIVAINCDAGGNNCEWYSEERVFQYTENGEFSVNGEKRGTYQVTGSTCVLDTGDKKYTLNIVSIDSTRLITGESDRTTTEILTKIE